MSIHHHHLLARIETKYCPQKRDKRHMERKLEQLVKDIQMKKLGAARLFYVGREKRPEEMGMSGILPIQTSHISFHFWSHPNRDILHSEESNCLVQFDLYTCGKLTKNEIREILHVFNEFTPTHASITLINRKSTMKVESHSEWQSNKKSNWNSYVSKY